MNNRNNHRARPAQGRRKKRSRLDFPILMGTLVALMIVGVCLLALRGGGETAVAAVQLTDIRVTAAPPVTAAPTAAAPTDAPTAQPTAVAPTAAPTAQPTAAPTEAPTPEPTPFEYLPVYTHGLANSKRIAITVDDCYQVDNLKKIASYAHKSGGKLTIFPIGENLSKPGMAELLKQCVFNLGFEVENHTWSHARIFRMPEAEMAAEIWKQSQAVNQALGVDYQQHFFRLMGGDGTNDQRTHNYLKQLGYLGIAEWSLSGSDAGMDLIKSHLSPGAIYLFHTTDADTEKLRTFIPWAVSQGYQLVTMNELLGLEENAVTTLSAREMPQPQHFDTDYHTHRKGDYAWIVVQMQDKLRQMGYLKMDGPSTGYYGDQTAAAVKAFQTAQGLSTSGEADAATQKMILGVAG